MHVVRYLVLLRVGLGLWWLESFRHKNKKAWFEKGSGISWAASVAEKHRWGFVRTGFEKVVAPRPKQMAYLVVFGEGAIGLGLVLGFLTPIALVASLLLNIVYFVLMIHDWAEQGQNSMMALIAVACLGLHVWYWYSLDSVFNLFGAH